jgi:GntR family transcriptional regulator
VSSSTTHFLGEQLVTAPGQPIRVAVYSRLADGIRSGVFRLGEMLPREIEIGHQLGVSRTPVREALMLLEEDGLIRTKRGVGRFVADVLPCPGLEQFQPFDEVMSEPGAAVTASVVTFELQQTTDFISNKLALDSAANTWFRESVLVRAGEPVAIVQEHLPAGKYLADINPAVAREIDAAAAASTTLLAALIERCGPVFDAGVCQIAANIAGETRAQLLDLKRNDPVLVLTQTAEFRGTPLYLSKCIVSSHVGNLSIIQSSGLPG